MDKQSIIETLEQIARLLELKGENAFKVRAYLHGARTLETAPLSANALTDPSALSKLEGIGKAIAEKIATLASTGRLDYFEELKAQFPPTIFELFEIQGLGPRKIKVLYDTLRIASVDELEAACKSGKVAALPGFGEKTVANLLKAISFAKKGAGRFLFGSVASDAICLLEDLQKLPSVTRAVIAGSFRRRKETLGDLDFLVSTRSPESVSDFFVKHSGVAEILAQGATKSSVRLANGMQCDLRVVSEAEFPFALNYFTGSKEHNVRMRGLCLERGWTLNEYRLSKVESASNAEPIPEIHEEADLYRALGMDYVPPELRENLGEIEAARNGCLPRLIELENLRGTFHNHTTASDGRNSLLEMAEAARELGLEYLGIADHSKASFQAHGLDEKRLLAQIEEIRELNERLDGITLLAGTECDILKDGSLDFSDEILSQLDYVVASVHSSFQLSETAMTARIIRAISNPYVTMLGHMTGRLLLSREPYQLDIPAVLDAAASTGTIVELNANPRRLDLDWRWWPLAKEKGVKCAINTDAHSTQGLQDLFFGVGIARKGWLTREDVINCLPLARVREVLSAKRKHVK
jgi:DNA polymerase (family 10)